MTSSAVVTGKLYRSCRLMLRIFGFHVSYRQKVPCTYIVETILKESAFFEFLLKSSCRLACLNLGIYPRGLGVKLQN